MSEHHKIFAAAYLILRKEDRIFLIRRANTGYQDGKYGLPAGHLEQGEQPSDTAIRESKEESGIDVLPEDIHFVHAMHRADDGQDGREYDDFFFICDKWNGEPHNAEPSKCDDVGWFPLDHLPENLISYIKTALECIRNKQFYSEQ